MLGALHILKGTLSHDMPASALVNKKTNIGSNKESFFVYPVSSIYQPASLNVVGLWRSFAGRSEMKPLLLPFHFGGDIFPDLIRNFFSTDPL
jgi:hypothetical protein